jgi:hypothetical protein
MPRPVSQKLGAWLAAATIGLLTTTTSIETVRAREGLSLADLAGSYSGRQGGFDTLCFNAAGQPADCTDPSSVALSFNDAEVLQGTLAPNGQFCFTDTSVFSPIAGSNAPATVLDGILTGSITSYNPKTGSGTISFTDYSAAAGVSCKLAIVVNPSAAQPISHGTADFAAGAAPALHLDLVVTSITAVDGSYGGIVLGGTLYIQE